MPLPKCKTDSVFDILLFHFSTLHLHLQNWDMSQHAFKKLVFKRNLSSCTLDSCTCQGDFCHPDLLDFSPPNSQACGSTDSCRFLVQAECWIFVGFEASRFRPWKIKMKHHFGGFEDDFLSKWVAFQLLTTMSIREFCGSLKKKGLKQTLQSGLLALL